ncbi:MAG: hypothetical protein NTW25_16080 [Candidatus Kapabacteria bacterium]|nr:hypothetical protein [Candidatus Kapabacteria bacterium]
MKNKIYLILLLFLNINLFGQDFEPKAWKFKWGSDTSARILNIDSFPQSRFITGFQWSGTPKMDSLMLNNASSGGYLLDSHLIRSKANLIIGQPTVLSRSNYGVLKNCVAMQYEPTLLIDTNNLGVFKTRTGDPSNPVFGFKSI